MKLSIGTTREGPITEREHSIRDVENTGSQSGITYRSISKSSWKMKLNDKFICVPKNCNQCIREALEKFTRGRHLAWWLGHWLRSMLPTIRIPSSSPSSWLLLPNSVDPGGHRFGLKQHPLKWQIWFNFLAPSFSLAQPQSLQVFGE